MQKRTTCHGTMFSLWFCLFIIIISFHSFEYVISISSIPFRNSLNLFSFYFFFIFFIPFDRLILFFCFANSSVNQMCTLFSHFKLILQMIFSHFVEYKKTSNCHIVFQLPLFRLSLICFHVSSTIATVDCLLSILMNVIAFVKNVKIYANSLRKFII